MEIGKMLNDVRSVLAPQIPVEQASRQFEGDLRSPDSLRPLQPAPAPQNNAGIGGIIGGLVGGIGNVPQNVAQDNTPPIAYLIEDNNNPNNDRYVRVTYSPTESGMVPLYVDEYRNNGQSIRYNSAKEFFDSIRRNGNYTIVSAPVDVTSPNAVKDLSDENDYYLSHATAFYDTEADGEINPEEVFSFGRTGVHGVGDRRNFRRDPGDTYAPGSSPWIYWYRDGKIRRGTRNRALVGSPVFSTNPHQI